MSHRLQVLVDDKELREFRRAARRSRLTVSEWVRQTLRTAVRQQPVSLAGQKLDALRRAAANSFPAGDIDEMLREIERGYMQDDSN